MPLLRVIATTLLLPAVIAAVLLLPAEASSGLRGFVPYDSPRLPPSLTFTDGQGQPLTLGTFSGMVVLLNVWASWCGPCVAELPALDRLQAEMGGQDFQVVAISVDRGAGRVVEPFLLRIGAKHLPVYLDPESRTLRQLGVGALPTSFLLNRQGRIIGRLEGDPDWDSEEARRLIEDAIGESPPPDRSFGLIRTSG